MPIPQVATEALRDAMARFDRDFRDATEWADWEQNKAHLYAIEHDGQRYPVKQIVSGDWTAGFRAQRGRGCG
jgi:5-methylcytosine-specific restriction enzyme A